MTAFWIYIAVSYVFMVGFGLPIWLDKEERRDGDVGFESIVATLLAPLTAPFVLGARTGVTIIFNRTDRRNLDRTLDLLQSTRAEVEQVRKEVVAGRLPYSRAHADLLKRIALQEREFEEQEIATAHWKQTNLTLHEQIKALQAKIDAYENATLDALDSI